MTAAAIRVEGLCKEYRIGRRGSYKTLRETLSDTATRPVRWLRSLARAGQADKKSGADWFWALKDVSFEVAEGAIIGIVGRNGAGKSTLLKVLSRITEPTAGRVEIHGRVGSLLEVGTGFHPELTGRENILLNGAILGMSKKEILGKFDEIVAFAELERFIDTPVKHFSSGMYMRLAFAVAAHLEPDILLIDEVLAVGDAAFQQRCLGKVDQVAKDGRTVIFVTHQMNQIRRLCHSVIWIDDGQLRRFGDTTEVVAAYEVSALSSAAESNRHQWSGRKHGARFVSWEIAHPGGWRSNRLMTEGPFAFRFALEVDRSISDAHHAVVLRDFRGDVLWSKDTSHLHFTPGTYELVYQLPGLPLRPGVYYLKVSLGDSAGSIDYWDCIPELVVATQPATHFRDEYAGLFNVRSQLEVEWCSPVADAERRACGTT